MDYRSNPRWVLGIMSNSGEQTNIRGTFSGAEQIPQLFRHDDGMPGQRDLRNYAIDGLSVEQDRPYSTRGSSHQSSAIRGRHPTWPYPRTDHYDFPVLRGRLQEEHPVHKLDVLGLPRSDQDHRFHDRNLSWTPGSDLASDLAHTSRKHVGTPINAETDHSRTPSPPYSLETRLVFEIRGQKQIYDLSQDQGQDPESIIELLKLSKSERGNWMMAGAYFRRKGNPSAALQVVATMVQVMHNHGYTLESLKAAFPLLAACELDLARLARNERDEKKYGDHFDNAKSWLQLVYGEDSPTLKSALQNALLPETVLQPVRTLCQPPPSQGTEGRSSKKYDPMNRTSRKLKTGRGSSGVFPPFVRSHGPPGRNKGYVMRGRRGGIRDSSQPVSFNAWNRSSPHVLFESS